MRIGLDAGDLELEPARYPYFHRLPDEIIRAINELVLAPVILMQRLLRGGIVRRRVKVAGRDDPNTLSSILFGMRTIMRPATAGGTSQGFLAEQRYWRDRVLTPRLPRRDADNVLHWTINGAEITSFTHTAPVGLIKFLVLAPSTGDFDMHLKGMEICSNCSFPVNAISFTTDSCTFSETCPFVPPLNVPVLLKGEGVVTSLVAEQANFQTGNQLSGFSITVPFILEFQLDSAAEFEFALYSTAFPYASVLIGSTAGVWGTLRVVYGGSDIQMASSLQLGSPIKLTFETSRVTLSQGGAFVSDTTAIQWTHGLTKVDNSLVGTASYTCA